MWLVSPVGLDEPRCHIGCRIAVQVMLEPVRSYVSGTIEPFERYRLTAFRDSVLQFTVE